MDEVGTEQPDPGQVLSPIPWTFTCAIWVPTFAVVLWFMLRLFGPTRVVLAEDDDETDS